MSWWAVVNNQNDTVSAIYHRSNRHPGELPVPCPAGSRVVKMSDKNSASVGYICLDDLFYSERPSPTAIKFKRTYLKRANEERKEFRMTRATEKIQELEDLIALDLATEAQKASLLPWRQHRMELRKVQEETTATLDWPESPEEEANKTDIEPIVT